MLLLKPFSNDHGRLMLQGKPLAPLTFITRVGFSAITLAYVLDSLVRVQDGTVKDILTRSPKPLDHNRNSLACNLLPPHKQDLMRSGPSCLSNGDTLGKLLAQHDPFNSDQRKAKLHPSVSHRPNNNLLPLPSQQFQVYLTLFSKFFSSFLHSTRSLSVSHSYLALEEVYLPFSAAIPGNTTLRLVT